MGVCTFLGHRDTPKEAEPHLYTALADLIRNKGVDLFYVGNNGSFDFMVQKILNKLKLDYPNIRYFVVLAYMPRKQTAFEHNFENSIYPDGMENTPPKYAIIKRNKWMIDKSDFVVTYVKRPVGGAAQFKSLAEKKNKTVINIADLLP